MATQVPKKISDLIRSDAPASAARTALGLGTAATTAATAYAAASDPFAVGSLPGMVGLWDKLSARWQDTAATTAATTAGQGVQRWKNQIKNISLDLQASANNPTLAFDGGDPTIQFTRSGNLRLQATWSPGSVGDFAIHALCKWTGTSFGTLLTLNSSGTSTLVGLPWTTGNPIFYPADTNGYSPWAGTLDYHLISFVRAGSTIRFYVDGLPVDWWNYGAALAPDQISLAYSSFSGQDLRVAAFALAVAAHSPRQVADLASYWRSQFAGAWARPSKSVYWLCNSLGTALYADVSNDIASKVVGGGYTPSASASWNASVGGKATAHMLLDYVARSLPFGNIATAKTCYVLWEGTNDIVVNGASGATAAANLFTLSDAIRAANPAARVVIGTIIDRVATGFATAKAACNTALIAGASAHGVTLADLTGIALVSADGAATNATYFADSTTHLNSAGNDLIKATFGTAIEAALAS